MLICPVCKTKLLEEPKRFCCMQGHAYDKAKSGYVNLLIGSSAKSHGDDEAMVMARNRFLSANYYLPLQNALIQILRDLKLNTLVDLGCGEGTYTNALYEALKIDMIGIDLSKSALKLASKNNPKIKYVLANITKAPINDKGTDAVLSVFSPFELEEARRIAQRYLIVVGPLPRHLIQLKEVLYTHVIENPKPVTVLPQTSCILEREIIFDMKLDHTALMDLLQMTPYQHTSPQSSLVKVSELSFLTVSAQFYVSVFMLLHDV